MLLAGAFARVWHAGIPAQCNDNDHDSTGLPSVVLSPRAIADWKICSVHQAKGRYYRPLRRWPTCLYGMEMQR